MKTLVKIQKTEEGKLLIKKELSGTDIYAFLSMLRELEGYINGTDVLLINNGDCKNFKITYTTHKDSKGVIKEYRFEDIVPADRLISSDIIEDCERFFNLSIDELAAKNRERYLCKPRQFIMALCKSLTKDSNAKIGSYFGNRDHSTVMHAHRRSIPDYIFQKDEEILYWIDYFSGLYNEENLLNKLSNE